AAVSAVPPDLVAVAAAGSGQEVAGGQVLDVGAARLPDQDAVTPRDLQGGVGRAGLRAAGQRAVDHDPVPVHAAEVDAGRRDEHAGRVERVQRAVLVIVARTDQDPVAGVGGVDRGLDAGVLAG